MSQGMTELSFGESGGQIQRHTSISRAMGLGAMWFTQAAGSCFIDTLKTHYRQGRLVSNGGF